MFLKRFLGLIGGSVLLSPFKCRVMCFGVGHVLLCGTCASVWVMCFGVGHVLEHFSALAHV